MNYSQIQKHVINIQTPLRSGAIPDASLYLSQPLAAGGELNELDWEKERWPRLDCSEEPHGQSRILSCPLAEGEFTENLKEVRSYSN